VDAAYKAATADLPTPKLTRALIDAVARQAPPRSGLFRPKLRYAHQGGRNPPLIVIHGNALDKIPDSYRRYLEHTFREVFQLQGTPLQIQFNVSTTLMPTRKLPNRTGASPSRPRCRRPEVLRPEKKHAQYLAGKPDRSRHPGPIDGRLRRDKPRVGKRRHPPNPLKCWHKVAMVAFSTDDEGLDRVGSMPPAQANGSGSGR
jgi:hypothetical protein